MLRTCCKELRLGYEGVYPIHSTYLSVAVGIIRRLDIKSYTILGAEFGGQFCWVIMNMEASVLGCDVCYAQEPPNMYQDF